MPDETASGVTQPPGTSDLGHEAEARAALAAALGLPPRQALDLWTPDLPLDRFLRELLALVPWGTGVVALILALERCPEDPTWARWDTEPSLEQVLLHGHPEDSAAVLAAQRALQAQHGVAAVSVVHRRDAPQVDLTLGPTKPRRLEGLCDLIIHGPDLLAWRPDALVGFMGVHLPGVQGVWDLGSATKGSASSMHRQMPTEFDLTDGLGLRLEEIRVGCLRVLRPLLGGGQISYAVPPGCSEVGPGAFQPDDPVDSRYPLELRGMRDPGDWVSKLHRVSDLTLSDLHLEKWPDEVEVTEGLDLIGVSGVRELPRGIQLGLQGHEERSGGQVTLKIENCPDFESLPEGIQCPSGLILSNLPKFRELPKGINSSFMCSLRNLPIETIPSDFNFGDGVHGYLILEGLQNLKTIPKCIFKPYTTMIIQNCGVEALPEGLSVISLVLRDLPGLESLPSGCKINSDLEISGCPNLRFIPSDLYVNSTIKIDAEIKHLVPDCLASRVEIIDKKA